MKTIYLRDENYNWRQFQFENNVSELAEELAKRNISIGYGASIGDGASIGYGANIGDEIKLITGLFIAGSKHSVTYAGNGKISCGCHTHTIQEWEEGYALFARREGYSKEQVQEYLGYLKLVKLFHEALPQPEPAA